MLSELRPALVGFLILSAVTGVLYPFVITGIAQLAFPDRANGSLVVRNGNVIGSRLIGQPFSAQQYFWSRPSATTPVPYNAGASGGSNLGPLNPALADGVKVRIAALRAANPDSTASIPVDLVTTSASGLDPHISPAAADYQVPRVARVRGLSEDEVRALVVQNTEARQFGLGEAVVNVLALNIALDAAAANR